MLILLVSVEIYEGRDMAMQYHNGAEELEPMGKMSLLSSDIWGNSSYLLGVFPLQELLDEI